jgi:hypothetical protein
VSLLIGGAGFADAATGGTFILGKANKETATASLANSKGTPLVLSAPAGKAPLAVSRNVMVKNLNAEFLGGLTGPQLQATGGDGFTGPGTHIPLTGSGTVVASTGPLPAGTYYVIATAFLIVAAGDQQAFCEIIRGSEPSLALMEGGEQHEGFVQAAETAVVSVSAGDKLQELCFTSGSHGSETQDEGIVAIRIRSSSGTPPA